ncbi:MAG: NusG domain II-containing protein [Treponema sp.]
MYNIFNRIRIFDYLILGIILSIALWSAFWLYGTHTAPAGRLIIESPHGKWIYPLNKDKTLSIPGALGTSEIRIENNTAFVVSSPCTNKICIAAQKLKKHGDWNACLPNKVFLYIEGGDTEIVPVSH